MASNFDKMAIFDHIPKTAGTSIAAWLVAEYGNEKVFKFTHELHSEVAKHHNDYKVACGHTYFKDREGLSRYCSYSTILRNPIDRVISWIYFALAHDTKEMEETKIDCMKILNGCQDELCHNVHLNTKNYATEHFCQIYGSSGDSSSDKLKNAINAIDEYSVIGVYEDIGSFLQEFRKFLSPINSCVQFPQENVTAFRPNIEDIPTDTRKFIEKINAVDVEFYNAVVSKLKSLPKNRTFFV